MPTSTDTRICDVCERVREVKVVNSMIGGFSIAVCPECLAQDAGALWEWEQMIEECGGPAGVAQHVRDEAVSWDGEGYIRWDAIVERANGGERKHD